MIVWNPVTPTGFRIQIDASFNFIRFIEEPIGNTKTFDDIMTEHKAAQTEPARRQVTQAELAAEQDEDFTQRNNLEVI